MTALRTSILLAGMMTLWGCQPKEQVPAILDGVVVGIKDGDTFAVLVDGREQVVRLADIDCPERSQPFGKAAKQFAADLCYRKEVRVLAEPKKDRYGRLIGTVELKDGLRVNEELVRAGYAWHYLKYSDDEEYVALERNAREARVGLWADTTALPPWEWRKKRRPQ